MIGHSNALDAAYARIPKIDCKGRCHTTCAHIGLSPLEAERMEASGPPMETAKIVAAQDEGSREIFLPYDPCPFLVGLRCSVYQARPMICRLWGVVEDMPCPYGCKPEGGYLSRREGFELLADAMTAGGVRGIDKSGIARALASAEGRKLLDELTTRGQRGDARRMGIKLPMADGTA